MTIKSLSYSKHTCCPHSYQRFSAEGKGFFSAGSEDGFIDFNLFVDKVYMRIQVRAFFSVEFCDHDSEKQLRFCFVALLKVGKYRVHRCCCP